MRLGLSILAALACVFGGVANASAAKHAPKVKHVFTIVLENKNYDATFGDAATEAPYLARKLPAKGRLLSQYHGTGHFSLGNYITLMSGQSENPVTQADCTGGFNDVTPGTIGADGQALGAGCVYPPEVRTVADQLEAAGKTWRGYMEDMGKDPTRDGGTTCAHPAIGTPDAAQKATATDQYATRHNPFMYFHSIIDDGAACAAHVVNLQAVRHDLRKPKRTRNYSFITPDLCSDGHDEVCANPSAGLSRHQRLPAEVGAPDPEVEGVQAKRAADRHLRRVRVRLRGLLLRPAGAELPAPGPERPGRWHTGAVLLSPFIKRGTVDATPSTTTTTCIRSRTSSGCATSATRRSRRSAGSPGSASAPR